MNRFWTTFSHSDILKTNSNVLHLSCIFLHWSVIQLIVSDDGGRWLKALFTTQKLTDVRNCISELSVSLRSSSSPSLYISSSFLSLGNKWKPCQQLKEWGKRATCKEKFQHFWFYPLRFKPILFLYHYTWWNMVIVFYHWQNRCFNGLHFHIGICADSDTDTRLMHNIPQIS